MQELYTTHFKWFLRDKKQTINGAMKVMNLKKSTLILVACNTKWIELATRYDYINCNIHKGIGIVT